MSALYTTTRLERNGSKSSSRCPFGTILAPLESPHSQLSNSAKIIANGDLEPDF